MLERLLEPEVMDSELDALEYQTIDNTKVNEEFAERALELCHRTGTLLDLGTGPGDIAILLAQREPGLRITAVDMAEHMLALAHVSVERHALQERVRIERVDAKATGYPDASFDMVVSNSLVHHIPEPGLFFREATRVARPGAGLFIKDLLRPSSKAELDALVTRYASDCSDYQRRLFSDSLHAALTVEEVRSLCRDVGLHDAEVRQCSDRHWSIERPFKGERMSS